MGRKKTKNTYWFDSTDEALDEYNSETVDWKRQKIFNEKLYYPLFRLCEYMINTKSTDYLQMNKRDKIEWLISELTMKLKDVNGDSNPFAYLYLAAHHLIIQHNKKAYKKVLSHQSIDNDDENEFVFHLPSDDESDNRVNDEWSDLFHQIVQQIEENIGRLQPSKSKREVIESLVDVMKDGKNWQMEHFMKDLTNILVQRTGMSQSVVRHSINTVRPIIRRMVNNYHLSGDVTNPESIAWLKRPGRPSLPKDLKGKPELLKEVMGKMNGNTSRQVFEEYGWDYFPNANQAIPYALEYDEEINWV